MKEKKRIHKAIKIICALTVAYLSLTAMALGQDPKDIPLLKPQLLRGKKLMYALEKRRSSRSISEKALSIDIISNLLWAANGINRPEEGNRTAPSAFRSHSIDIYAATKDGLYLYDAKKSMLKILKAEDIRKFAAVQNWVHKAPIILIYVADFADMKGGEADNTFYAAADSGYISQNVYLFCASEGLATSVIGSIDKPTLTKKMGLRKDQRIILAQPVGYPETPLTDGQKER